MATDTKHAIRERLRWLEDVLASNLDDVAKLLAVRIALYKNDRTGQCSPSEATLARGINKSARTVRRLRHKLRKLGWIAYTDNRGGRAKSTQHTLTKPGHNLVPLSEPKPGHSRVPLSTTRNPDRRSQKPGQPASETRTQLCPPNLKNLREPKRANAGSLATALGGSALTRPLTQATEQPVSEEEREQLANRMNQFIAEMKAKAKPRGW